MKKITGIITIAVMCGGVALAAGDSPAPLGFSEQEGADQLALEAEFDRRVNPDNLDMWMQRLTAEPHHLGAPGTKTAAEAMAEAFRSWGYEAEIETFHILFPTPKERVLQLLSPEPYTAALVEPAIEGDRTSEQADRSLPPYNAYSADGDVTGELIYVNQGIPADYEELERLGLDVKGKIVIARYGGSWRGIKPKLAQEHGALGVILYSDPADDGYAQGDAYPKGGHRNQDSVQRGSVIDLPLRPGDPVTPGVGATENAKRISREDSESLLKIPVLPISYNDALPFLKALDGAVAPDSWRGALPITYHVGPGPARVRLKLAFDWTLTPAYNVIAKLEGETYPDEWVMRGNHHDAWVSGAADPVSGMVALMEEARIVGELARAGNRPARTILYAGWDAEEPGLIGSVEWVEQHARELDAKLVAYINTDGTSRGFLNAGGSHTLEPFFGQIANAVMDPHKGITVGERRRKLLRLIGSEEQKKALDAGIAYPLSALGSGSDYSGFLQHLGIASLNIGFGGEGGGSQYHSAYDSYDHYVRFGDPGFLYGAALAKVAGRATLRLANADILPFDTEAFTRTVAVYLDQVTGLADNMRKETAEHNERVRDGIYAAVADPSEAYVPRIEKDPVPHLAFAALENALAKLRVSSAAFDEAAKNLAEGGANISKRQQAELNRLLYRMERKMIRAEGLPRRPWFVHHIYAPGFYTGYGVKTLPGVREAIEQRNWQEANQQIDILANILTDIATHMDQMTTLAEDLSD